MSGIPGLMADILALADCLKAKMDEAGLPKPCFHGVLPGEAVPLLYCDECDSGMSWVRLVSIEADEGGETPTARCFIGAQNATVELGIVRGLVVMDESGEPASVADQLDAFKYQMAAASAMLAALACCSLPSGAHVSQPNYAPMGPEGGCVGGTYTAVIEVI